MQNEKRIEMKNVFLCLLFAFCIAGVALGQSVEDQIQSFAAQQYPNDPRMRQYVYNKQIAAYRYMRTVADTNVKTIAVRAYPNDYAMQKYTYDRQLAAKQYMNAQGYSSAKSRAQRKYPNDYSMQKYTYDRILRR